MRTSAYTRAVVSRPALFIDRDGTLTEEVGYVNHPRRLRLLPRSAEDIDAIVALYLRARYEPDADRATLAQLRARVAAFTPART